MQLMGERLGVKWNLTYGKNNLVAQLSWRSDIFYSLENKWKSLKSHMLK